MNNVDWERLFAGMKIINESGYSNSFNPDRLRERAMAYGAESALEHFIRVMAPPKPSRPTTTRKKRTTR